MIEDFKEDDSKYTIGEIHDTYMNCFTCPKIDEQLSKIDSIVKWRDKISKKLSEKKAEIFDEEDHKIMASLAEDLNEFEVDLQNRESMKEIAMEYSQRKSR